MFNTDVLEQKILSYKSIRYRVKGKNHSLVMKNILDLYIRYMMISNIIQNFNIYTRYKNIITQIFIESIESDSHTLYNVYEEL